MFRNTHFGSFFLITQTTSFPWLFFFKFLFSFNLSPPITSRVGILSSILDKCVKEKKRSKREEGEGHFVAQGRKGYVKLGF